MKLKTKKLLLVSTVAAVLAGCNNDTIESSVSEPVVEQDVSMTLRLMETTDVHATMMPYNYFISEEANAAAPMPEHGFTRTSLVIQETRDEVPNSLLLDNGDMIQGSPMGDYSSSLGVEYHEDNVHSTVKLMNYLDYDVSTIGNHEFNYGLDFLDAVIKKAEFPYVVANVWKADTQLTENCEDYLLSSEFDSSEPMYDPYVILDREYLGDDGNMHTVKVGVIGVTPPQVMGWDAKYLNCNVVLSDIKDTAEYYVPKMKDEGADVVVMLSHAGLEDDHNEFIENATLQLGYVDGIDAILFGHHHRMFPNETGEYGEIEGVDPELGKINGIPAVQASFWGSKLGVIDLKLHSSDGGKTWDVDHEDSTSELRDLIPEQSDVVAEDIIAAEHQGTVDYMSATIAEIDVNINSFFPQVVPDLSMQIVNEAQLNHLMKWKDAGDFDDAASDAIFLSVSAPFKSGRNGAEDYTNIQEGEFTNASVADIYVFDNNIPAALKMTGADLKKWIEWINSNAYNNLPLQDGENFLVEEFPGYNFDTFFGGFDEHGEGRIKYKVNVEKEPRFVDINGFNYTETSNGQLEDLTFDGMEIADDREVYVVTNSYRASNSGIPGIDNAEVVKEDAAYNNRELVQFYLDERLAEQGGDMLLEFPNSKVFELVAPNTQQVEFSSATLDEAFRCGNEVTGLSTTQESATKEGTEGFTKYYFNFDYSGEYNCSYKGL